MKTIGLIGGMSWESSKLYYEWINEAVRDRLGGLHSSKCLLYSFDFDEIKQLQFQGDWAGAEQRMVAAAQILERAGADFIVVCTNTMHMMAEAIQRATRIPLLHIADATAERIVEQGIRKVGLLATMFTMEESFYKGRLEEKYGLQVTVPNRSDRERVHSVIYDELCRGVVSQSSKQEYLGIIDKLLADGAEAIILGCTEITMLIKQEDLSAPLFDTTKLHALAAVECALS